MSRRLPHTSVTVETWREICAWLDSQRGKCSYRNRVPFEWQWLFVLGSPEAADAREEANWPIFYRVGWGWRLHKDWRERLDAPPGSYAAALRQGKRDE